MRSLRLLILGGSSEASALGRAIAQEPGIDATLSLAGRTATPLDGALKTRTGGFGGVEGLIAYLDAEHIDMMVDATHPFAARMSTNARLAAERTGIPLVRLSRPGWQAVAGDDWREVSDMAQAAEALGSIPKRVFLTVGRLHLSGFAAAPQHNYIVRSIDPVGLDHGLPQAVFIQARGPFSVETEIRLMREHRIEMLVTKNSGGTASAAKLEAARELSVPVILIRRPPEDTAVVTEVADVLAAIHAHRLTLVPRGV